MRAPPQPHGRHTQHLELENDDAKPEQPNRRRGRCDDPLRRDLGDSERRLRAKLEVDGRRGLDGRALPDLGECQNLGVMAGNELAFHAYAGGVQIYRWNGASWTFVAPEAVLYADAGENSIVGIHYAGPTWESVSGSKVVGRVSDRCTPDSSAIPWLVLEAVYTERHGIFAHVTYIQRLNTVGGLAPTAPGTVVGEEARVPYTAEYLFYRAQD
jgi:hypothetical protein